MTDSRRLHVPPPSPAAVDRDSQTEALLIDGLDHYFGGRYEEAIHLWTRVLFLDRSHARARAYIDRARTALAERQRLADQMLHETDESLAQGDTTRARRLLTEAVETAGDDERAAGLRVRLERLERARAGTTGDPGRQAAVVDAVPLAGAARTGTRPVVLAAVVAATLLALVTAGLVTESWVGIDVATPPPVTRRSTETPPTPTASEVALIRARTLFSQGRLAEALLTLDRVGDDSDERTAADALRVRIQQVLLALEPSGLPAADTQVDPGNR